MLILSSLKQPHHLEYSNRPINSMHVFCQLHGCLFDFILLWSLIKPNRNPKVHDSIQEITHITFSVISTIEPSMRATKQPIILFISTFEPLIRENEYMCVSYYYNYIFTPRLPLCVKQNVSIFMWISVLFLLIFSICSLPPWQVSFNRKYTILCFQQIQSKNFCIFWL